FFLFCFFIYFYVLQKYNPKPAYKQFTKYAWAFWLGGVALAEPRLPPACGFFNLLKFDPRAGGVWGGGRPPARTYFLQKHFGTLPFQTRHLHLHRLSLLL
ncbi:hypothetical protein ACVGWD_00445, partial [Enterobacter asburiae]